MSCQVIYVLKSLFSDFTSETFFVHKITSIRAKLTADHLPDVEGDERSDLSNADIIYSLNSRHCPKKTYAN